MAAEWKNDALDSAATQSKVTVGKAIEARIAGTADHDWFAVTLEAGKTYSIAAVGIGVDQLDDPVLKLWGTNGRTLLAQDDNGMQNKNALMTVSVAKSGTYYIDVSGDSPSYGDYGLSVALGSKANLSTAMVAGVIDTGLAWTPERGIGATVTYGFRETYSGSFSGFQPFSELERAAARAVISQYSEFTGLKFVEVNPGGTTDNAAILLGNYSAQDGQSGFGYYPGSTDPYSASGDMWINSDRNLTEPVLPGDRLWDLLLHEFGHTLGLSHPGIYSASAGTNITYAGSAQIVQDSTQFSMMSYFDAATTGASEGESDTPRLLDVLALQQIYGANMTTRAGNTVYGFGSKEGPIYDFAINHDPFLTIWDGGGRDLIDASGFHFDQKIDLREGTFSNIGGFKKNVAVAFDTVIENATGGRGSDTLIGNRQGNKLSGGLGNDTLKGGNGDDTLLGGAGSDKLIGGRGNDLLDSGGRGEIPDGFGLVTTDFLDGAKIKIDNADLFPTGSFTLELIWQQAGTDNPHYGLDFGGLSFYRQENGDTAMMFWDATSQDWNWGAVDKLLTDGAPHRLSITYDDPSGICIIYIDGNQVNENSFPSGSRGLAATGGIVLDDNGAIGGIRIFDFARSATEIWDNAWSTIDPDSKGLVQYWRGDGAGHLASQIEGKADMESFGPVGTSEALLWDYGGVETLKGGKGADTYIVYSSDDRVIESRGGGRDTVLAKVDYKLGTNARVEVLRADAGDTGLALAGNGYKNRIYGGDGADTLTGGGGKDHLYSAGDTASETFVFTKPTDSRTNDGRDVIHGFASGRDKIDLHGMDANKLLSGLQDFDFNENKASANAVWWTDSGKGLRIYGDVDGDSQADFSIELRGIHTVVESDFILSG